MFVYLFYSVEIAVISAVLSLTKGWNIERLKSISGLNRPGGALQHSIHGPEGMKES